jgi:CRP/FNR family cyclic AMP-dependent transcriptional regulator
MYVQTMEQELTAHPFFAGLAPEYIGVLVGCSSNVHFDRDRYIMREGEPADTFYLIRHGKVALETHAPQGGPLVIETIEAGEALGWSWLFPPYRVHFSARALESVRAISLDGACLRGKCERDHDLGYALMQRFASVVIQRLQATRLQLLDLYAVPARGAR